MVINNEIFIKIIIEKTKSYKKENGVLFSKIINLTSNVKILEANDDYIKNKITLLIKYFNEILLDSKNNPIKSKRVNESGNRLEPILRKKLNSEKKFKCEIPLTKLSKKQSSGYPDLVIEDSDKNIYIEVKLYKNNSKGLNSTLRTFYYEPKVDTNKINKNGYHLLIGFGHSGKKENMGFSLDDWHLVDLFKVRVNFKGEFQTNNKSLYSNNNLITKSNF